MPEKFDGRHRVPRNCIVLVKRIRVRLLFIGVLNGCSCSSGSQLSLNRRSGLVIPEG